ncbi:MAG: tRNA uracil 4-sulfurtransferase ThiI [Acholeplasmataceae bacterium]|jgi:thiamine biosynthesis protein ThiI|nr:tRNA uracil 4-sulfurtransferase ThiI [Acholeplasmataceae bacterium]
MKKKILIRFGDMMLKGKNIGFFIKRVRKHLVEKLKDLETSYQFTHDRIYIDYNLEEELELINRIYQIPGIFSFSIVHVSNPTIEDIIQTGVHVLNEEATKPMMHLKIETRRADKDFPMTSQDITLKIASPILNQANLKYVVDVKNPEETLRIELRRDYAYVYLRSYKGAGGFPYGTQGKGLLMLSGGIDSPVAGYLTMKQGIEVELIHFDSSPLTPLESTQKVIELAKVLSAYTLDGYIKLHIVPFTELHELVLKNIFDPYIITVMRRMMYRIAEKFAIRNKLLCLINGESVGQVASQTLPSMQVVESVTKIPVLRPLITYDKLEIIKIAEQIGSFPISIQPFNDCCSVYVPKNPVTKPMEVYAKKYESTFEFEDIIYQLVRNSYTLNISKETQLILQNYGFTLKEAMEAYTKECEAS